MSSTSEPEGEESSSLKELEKGLVSPHEVVEELLADTARQLPDTCIATTIESMQHILSLVRNRHAGPSDHERRYADIQLLRLSSTLEESAAAALAASRIAQASLDFSRPVLVNT